MRIIGLKCPSCGANVSSETMKCEYCGTNLLILKDGSINWDKVWDLVYEWLKGAYWSLSTIKEAVWKALGEYKELPPDFWEYKAKQWIREGKLRPRLFSIGASLKDFYYFIWRCEKCGGEVDWDANHKLWICKSCDATYPEPQRYDTGI